MTGQTHMPAKPDAHRCEANGCKEYASWGYGHGKIWFCGEHRRAYEETLVAPAPGAEARHASPATTPKQGRLL